RSTGRGPRPRSTGPAAPTSSSPTPNDEEGHTSPAGGRSRSRASNTRHAPRLLIVNPTAAGPGATRRTTLRGCVEEPLASPLTGAGRRGRGGGRSAGPRARWRAPREPPIKLGFRG